MEEITSILGHSRTKLDERCKKEFDKTFSDFMADHRRGSKERIRRVLWRKALEEEDVKTILFLARNVLGMNEKLQIEASMKKPLQVIVMGGKRIEF